MDNKMIREQIELDIPVDLTTDSAIELLKTLEAKVKELKDAQYKQFTQHLKDADKIDNTKYEVRQTDVYRKVLDLDVVDEKFKKVEVKPNTKAINEYQKEHKKLPKGVDEVFYYSRFVVSDKIKREESKKKRQEYLEKQKPKETGNPLEGIKFKSLEDRK